MKGNITIKLLVHENARIGYKPQAEKTFIMYHNLPFCTDIDKFVKSACSYKYGTVPMKILDYKFTPDEDD